MADDTRTNNIETPDIEDDTEPTTEHEAAEGGVLGAFGGAVVGALAGGPIGAVIGAVIGGIVSAGAVEAVERYEHKETEHSDEVSAESVVDQPNVVPAESADLPSAATPIVPVEVSIPVMPVEEPETVVEEPVALDLSPQIRERAYEIYELRGRSDGHDVEDWLQAESEVLAG